MSQKSTQELNAVTALLRQFQADSEFIKKNLSAENYDNTVRLMDAAVRAKLQEIAASEETTRTQQTMQFQNRANTRKTNLDADLLDLEKKLYQDLNLPSKAVEQILKMFLLFKK